jgi:signal transduction histidine kinase
MVGVADLVRHAADAAATRPVTRVDAAVENVVMRADKRRLERVVTNLVGNAEVHGRGCEAVRVSRADGFVRIAVDDRGDGISAEGRERIFDRFTRDGSGRGPGVGLGLAIVARHVHWHGGEVWVENRDGGGARFVVELPVTADLQQKRAGTTTVRVSRGDGAAPARATAPRAASRTAGSPAPPART